MMLATRLQGLAFSIRLTAVMVALIWLTAAVSYFGPAASLAAALLLTVLAVVAAADMARPLGKPHEATCAPGTDASREMRTEAERSYGAAMDSIAQSVITFDLESIITAWNPGAERLYGFSAAEAIGHPSAIIVPEDRRREIGEVTGRLRRGEQVGDFETKRRRRIAPSSMSHCTSFRFETGPGP